MGDSRRHRGPHPTDAQLFSERALPALTSAVEDLSWLRTRGYGDASAVKLVGDRYRLRSRQRTAAKRCACSDSARRDRASRRWDLARISAERYRTELEPLWLVDLS